MRGLSLPFVALALVGCTALNPNWQGNGDVGSGGGSAGSGGAGKGGAGGSGGSTTLPDLGMGGLPDLSMSDPPDLLPPPPVCSPGDRQCANGLPPASQLCDKDGQWNTRVCPVANDPHQVMCMDGYCAPPSDAQNCLVGNGPSEDACYNIDPNLSCEPFIDAQNNGWMWFCVKVVGTGASGDPCTSGAQCRSGFCGSNGTCFRACQNPSDCPQHTPKLSCKQVTIDVEGVTTYANSCVP